MPETGPKAKAAIKAGKSEKSNLIKGGIKKGIGNSIHIKIYAIADNIPVTAKNPTLLFFTLLTILP